VSQERELSNEIINKNQELMKDNNNHIDIAPLQGLGVLKQLEINLTNC